MTIKTLTLACNDEELYNKIHFEVRLHLAPKINITATYERVKKLKLSMLTSAVAVR